jgi:hypothetical protein
MGIMHNSKVICFKTTLYQRMTAQQLFTTIALKEVWDDIDEQYFNLAVTGLGLTEDDLIELAVQAEQRAQELLSTL